MKLFTVLKELTNEWLVEPPLFLWRKLTPLGRVMFGFTFPPLLVGGIFIVLLCLLVRLCFKGDK